MGERLQVRRGESIKIFHGKEQWYLNNASAQMLRKEKKS